MTVPLIIFLAVEFVLSIILCFAGYKYRRVMVSIYSFMIAFLILFSFAQTLDFDDTYKLIGAIVAGLIIAGIVGGIYRLAMFMSGGGLGLIGGIIVCHYFSIEYSSIAGIIILVSLTIAASALSVAYKKPIIVISSAALGAFIMSAIGAFSYITFYENQADILGSQIQLENALLTIYNTIQPLFSYVLMTTAAIGLLGFFIQFKGKGKKNS